MLRKNKIMLILIVITITLGLGFGLVNFVQGHSPSGMSLIYHTNTETLDVTITHSVSNLQTHYVVSVNIYINDILNHTEGYTSQPSNTFTYFYDINATLNDAIKVTAACNQGGSITRTITVSDGSNGTPTVNTTLNGICAFLIGLPLLGLVTRYHSRRRK